jgi:hypothetical protein
MSDYILKQNAGRGGAAYVAAGGTIPAGEYVSMTALGALTAITATTPLITGTLAVVPVGVTINSLFTSTGTATITGGPAIFYKGVTI